MGVDLTKKDGKESVKKEKPAKKNQITQREKYIKELKTLINDVPDEGLLFLIRQSAVLIHNADSEKKRQMILESAEDKDEEEKGKTGGEINTVRKNSHSKRDKDIDEKTKSYIKKQPDSGPSVPGDIVTLEKGAFGKSFIMVIAGKRKTFGEDEIIALAKLVNRSKSLTGGCFRIFEWLKQNRNDVLLDTGIKSKDSAEVEGIYNSLYKG